MLLYKSKNPRAQDELDLRVATELLDDESRRWLIDAIALQSPQHKWIKLLNERAGR